MVKNFSLKNVDYIIVGRGFAGSSLAFQLEQNNISYVVFDDNLTKSSTKVAAGLMNPIVFKRLTKSWKTDEFIKYNKTYYPKMAEFLRDSFFKKLPIYKFFNTNEEQNDWELKKDVEGFSDYLGDVVFDFDNRIKAPYGAGVLNNSYVIDTEKYLLAWENYFVKHNKLICEKIDYSKLKIEEAVSYLNIQAKRIVFCEGSLYENNPYFNWLPFKLTKGEILVIKVPGLTTNFTLNKGFFMMPIENETYIVGATYEWKDLSYNKTQVGKQTLIDKIKTLINTPFEIIEHKAGVRPTVTDRKPILGKHPNSNNVFIYNGLGTKGGLMAPYLSKLFLDFLLGKNKLPAEISVERFYSSFE